MGKTGTADVAPQTPARDRRPAMPGGQRRRLWLRRAIAYWVDSLIISVVVFPLLLLRTHPLLPGVLSLSFILTYHILLLCRSGARNGQTLGKQLLRIRIVRGDGKPVDAALVLKREVLCKSLLGAFALPLVLPYLANYLWPLWDRQAQALHDKLSGTYISRA